jgi:uncharacterized protein (TIGR02246 family)
MSRRIAMGVVALALAFPLTASAQAATDLRAQIEKMDKAWQAAYNAGDAAAVAALYADDAKVMAPGAAAASGRAAIQAAFAQDIARGSKNTLTTEEVFGGGDYAIAVGGWVETGADGSHKDHGTYVTVYRKVGGDWKIYRDTWNSSMAPK